ncbi:hypothetical protein RND81_03G103800 [Saponaria officinalis]|uniref:F-box domain-containing protein n=1 Tax=Saponaria officinalis TaxID=3572 RepID=A0AAW1LZG7_SAPOF
MSINRNSKICRPSSASQPLHGDRLHDLPDELLTRILSMLPTKDASAMQVLSKRMRRAFTYITSLNIDDSPVSLCPDKPRHAKHSPIFDSFVDKTLQKFSNSGMPLARFRLFLGEDKSPHYHFLDDRNDCESTICYSNLEPTRLNLWISYPLAYSSLTELDLSFHVSNPNDFEIPVGIFTCRSLEVLKLDSNLEIDDNEFPLICLPDLKLLHLRSFVFTDDVFVTRLVSSCPDLEDLSITYCSWRVLDRLTISSRSLRRLVLDVWNYDTDDKHRDDVLIDAPNLEYFDYDDFLATSYSIVHMNGLAKTYIRIVTSLNYVDEDTCFRSHLSLITAFSHVQHLALLGYCVENVYFSGELKDQLPVFHALKTLELDAFFDARWDIVLSLFLCRSPLLETLIFPKGLCVDIYGNFVCSDLSREDIRTSREEAKAWRTNKTIPSCYMSRLKRIQVNDCYERNRELNMIRFFLRQAPALTELVIWVYEGFNPIALQRQLEQVLRASTLCSITVQ